MDRIFACEALLEREERGSLMTILWKKSRGAKAQECKARTNLGDVMFCVS